jgi:hypothetical protein
MVEPVMLVTGNTFERMDIEHYFRNPHNNKDPFSNV